MLTHGEQTSTRLWRPVIDRPDAWVTIRKIADRVADPDRWAGTRRCLADGPMSGALFLRYAGEALSEPAYLQASETLVDAAMSDFRFGTAGLFGGPLGLAWAIAHLDPENEALSDFDDYVLAGDSLERVFQGWDLVSGCVGLGVYALERHRSASGHALLSFVMRTLERIAGETEALPAVWFITNPQLLPINRERFPGGRLDLGLAHGVAGVIAFLAKVRLQCDDAALGASASQLLDRSVAALVSNALSDGSSRYPAWVAPGVAPEGTRAAWCYGDGGIAAALCLANGATGEPALADEYLLTLSRLAARTKADAGVVDAGLCHGAAGLAVILARQHNWSGLDSCREAAAYWFDDVLQSAHQRGDDGSFLALKPRVGGTGDVEWQVDDGFLTGASGIGLALLAGVSDVAPDWDHVLLAS